jgi:hypothetical protein
MTHESVMLRRPLTATPLLLLEDAAGAAAEDEEGALHSEVLEDEAAAEDHVLDCKGEILSRYHFLPWMVVPMPERRERADWHRSSKADWRRSSERRCRSWTAMPMSPPAQPMKKRLVAPGTVPSAF